MSASGAVVAQGFGGGPEWGPRPSDGPWIEYEVCPAQFKLAPGESGRVRGTLRTDAREDVVAGTLFVSLIAARPAGENVPPIFSEARGWTPSTSRIDFSVAPDEEVPFEFTLTAPPPGAVDATPWVMAVVGPTPVQDAPRQWPFAEFFLVSGAAARPGGPQPGEGGCWEMGYPTGMGMEGEPDGIFGPGHGPTPAEFAGALAAATTLVAAPVALAWRNENWRMRFFAPLLGLFTRLKKPQVLGHETREAIVAAVKAEPGITYSDLKRKFALNNGALLHHLRTLEQHHLITSRKEGKLRRFYPVGERLAAPAPAPLSPVAAEALVILRAEGERPFQELTERLNVSKQRLSYNVKVLEKRGLAEVARRETDGRWVVRLKDTAEAVAPAPGA